MCNGSLKNYKCSSWLQKIKSKRLHCSLAYIFLVNTIHYVYIKLIKIKIKTERERETGEEKKNKEQIESNFEKESNQTN